MLSVQAFIGIAILVAIGFAASRNRTHIPWRFVGIAILGQALTGAFFLHAEWARQFLGGVTSFANVLEKATHKATSFVFGYVGSTDLPFEVIPGSSTFIFAFQVLPVIMVIGALSALLWHWRVLGLVVSAGAWFARKTLGVSPPVGFSAVANAFLGMIESPLLIKPYLSKLATHELFMVMSVGMSTVAGGTAVIIAGIVSKDPEAFGNVITATLMNVPGAIAFSLLILPPKEESQLATESVAIESHYRSSMDALVTGTADGVKIFVNVISLLIVFITLVALIDLTLSSFVPDLSLARIMGYVLAPVTWLLGIEASEMFKAAEILGTKVAVNELVAYTYLADSYGTLSAHTHFVLTFALCGFGNFGSLAIMIGGISAMAPERREEIVRYGLWSLLVAFLTNCTTAALASIIGFQ
ncbi:MAG: nucleoside transporter C-terminal domain-containing protein [Woeseiaceae bacterium]